jgi:hypothetical protein
MRFLLDMLYGVGTMNLDQRKTLNSHLKLFAIGLVGKRNFLLELPGARAKVIAVNMIAFRSVLAFPTSEIDGRAVGAGNRGGL